MTREEDLSETFNVFLDRYSPPRHMANNPQAMQSEANALMKVILKFAPRSGYEAWLEEVLEQLAYQMKTRAWPTVNELGACARNSIKSGRHKMNAQEFTPKTDLEIMAERIHEGEPVADGFLYGAQAVELVSSGLVLESALRPYRSALYFKMKKEWGEDLAKKAEARFIARHEAAQKSYDNGKRYAGKIPDKTADKSHSYVGGVE